MPADTSAEKRCPRCGRINCQRGTKPDAETARAIHEHFTDRWHVNRKYTSAVVDAERERVRRAKAECDAARRDIVARLVAAEADRDAWANATYSETPAELSKAFADAATEHVRLSGELADERQAREAAEAIAHAAIDGIEILNQKAASIVADAHAIGLVNGADMAEMLAAVERSKAAASQLRAALSPEKETP